MSDQSPDQSKNVRPSAKESESRAELAELFKQRPIPDNTILDHLELFMRPQRISEILVLQQLYLKILNTHGVIVEFGVRWGRHLSVFHALRSIYEPYNFYRRIFGFDTFAGFLEPHELDGESDRVFAGSMAVSEGYEKYLEQVLSLHEAEAPLSHIKRFQLLKGDAPVELEAYLKDQPETIIALAYFDMDVYQPTRDCLQLILPHLAKGSIVAFDELMHPEFPGEAIALKEVLDISQHQIERFPIAPYPAFITI